MKAPAGISRRAMLAGAALAPLAGAAPASWASCVAEPPLFDAHIHFFTNDLAHYPIDPRNAREPEPVMRARILHAPVTPAGMLPIWDRLGVAAGLGVQYSGAYKADNRYVLDVSDAHPKRIGTEIILNPADPASPALLARLAEARHVSAIRLTGFVDADGDLPWLKSAGAIELLTMAQAMRLPVGVTYLRMVPTVAALARIRALSDRFPECRIVLEHLGWLGDVGSQDGLLAEHLALAGHANIAFKWTTLNVDALCSAGIAPAAFLRTAVETFGAARLMWGSDFGNTTRPYAGIVADARDATRLLGADQARAVLGGSARALFRI